MRFRSRNALPRRLRTSVFRCLALFAAFSSVLFSGCTELEKPRSDAFFAETKAPRKQELKWSNGRLPRSIDPAASSAAPETDVVRAVYEGLTELDPRTLLERPAAAAKWQSSPDHRQWTFTIRPDATWSNGDALTAEDFIRSWKRAASKVVAAPHRYLLNNIVGLIGNGNNGAPAVSSVTPVPNGHGVFSSLGGQDRTVTTPAPALTPNGTQHSKPEVGLQAADERTLIVSLTEPDPEFPKLMAHPIFRPVHSTVKGTGENLKPSAEVVTNGAFRIVSADNSGVVVERSANYWNRDTIRLDRVHFVPMDSAEKALEAYRAGGLDVITNATLSPVLLKLLSPYEDFRKTTFAALNLFEINAEKYPFSDRRIRQALSMAIERERLSDGELEGSTVPALTFMPFAASSAGDLIQDRQRAADLFDEAGFPNGEGFPMIRLVVNRNDTQVRIARSVAVMWRDNLNIATEIVIREASEIDDVRSQGDYDLVRRGFVLTTPDEFANIRTIFGYPTAKKQSPDVPSTDGSAGNVQSEAGNSGADGNSNVSILRPQAQTNELVILSSHEQSLFELRAIPLYFPTSYSLVKPFVVGFETNALDAPVLLDVSIDEDWQPIDPKRES